MSKLKNKLSSQIQESEESKAERLNQTFQDKTLKSLEFPLLDVDGYCTGIFSGFEPVAPTGEVKTNPDGSTWIAKQMQVKFTFIVPTESGGELPINFWTGTCIDGVKDKDGRYSKLVTWLIAVGAIDPKILHPKFKANETSVMNIIKELFDSQFRFKVVMKGRIHAPLIETFELVNIEPE